MRKILLILLVAGLCSLRGEAQVTKNDASIRWYTSGTMYLTTENTMRYKFTDSADKDTVVCWKNQCKRLEEIFPVQVPEFSWIAK